ncbi:acyl-ACP--UDP-N-acetylglucosamine O-acyltransferase [Suttonella ornithocola]|uniref:Acyl-[acyl-carrier-protein]--UDP-N-acetylglucosamine O-acyltransferase n=1 Tax=Suttonella ornithocola TaxID=279832 RepID=A0A380MY19_9GAMM|nr:acyl-ACP--UDP-N-acetylglucosamine O-acyltransferase [Suttonella ornithocola]SUO97114.1 Acyl-[acyl-carrier-protein]--UDP-N-acetylglucosamine O-acyltransferase [Suttonella ornithocola]
MIHPTAIIDPKAELADDVSIGAYSVIGANVHIDSATVIGPHVVIEGPTKIGKNNRIFQFASIGAMPQDKKYAGEDTWLEIGDNNTIREFVTFNRGTVQDGGVTKIGDDNWIMAYCHLAHDCIVGSHTVFANNASLAGHVHIGDYVILGGYALVYQFVHIGDYSILAFSSGVKQNVPPFSMVSGMPAKASGINMEGLRRHQFAQTEIEAIKSAFRYLYRENLLLSEAREKINQLAAQSDAVSKIAVFLTETGKRGLIR